MLGHRPGQLDLMRKEQGRGVGPLHLSDLDVGLFGLKRNHVAIGAPAPEGHPDPLAGDQLEPVRNKHLVGVGLGLTLVRDLATALGGKIDVSSEPGRGSTFAVVLPILRRARSSGSMSKKPLSFERE